MSWIENMKNGIRRFQSGCKFGKPTSNELKHRKRVSTNNTKFIIFLWIQLEVCWADVFGLHHQSCITIDVDRNSLVSTISHAMPCHIKIKCKSRNAQAHSHLFARVFIDGFFTYAYIFTRALLLVLVLKHTYTSRARQTHTKYRALITGIVWIMSHDMSRVFSIRLHRYIQLYDYCLFEQVKSLSPLCAYCILSFRSVSIPFSLSLSVHCIVFILLFFSFSLSLSRFISANKWKLGNQHKKVLPKNKTKQAQKSVVSRMSHVLDKDEWTRDRDTKVWVKWVSCRQTHSHRVYKQLQCIFGTFLMAMKWEMKWKRKRQWNIYILVSWSSSAAIV